MQITELINAAKKYYENNKNDSNGRSHSWEHCYKAFHDARNKSLLSKDYDYLSLHLAFYLASWGMYRSSSYLLKKDYRIHIPIVKEILDSKYDCLAGIECRDLENNIEKLKELNCFIRSCYTRIRGDVKENVKSQISNILVTKILLGTLGCVPAYDRYFIFGKRSVVRGDYNISSVLKLAEFYGTYSTELEDARKDFKMDDGLQYPQFKVLDMGFWQLGYDSF